MNNNLIYKDEHCYITYGPEGVVDGHVKIFPLKPAKRLNELSSSEVVYLFDMAGKIASILFDGLGAHGTNIICNDGILDKSLCINVIPRFNNDNLGLEWQPKPGDRSKLEKIEEELKPQLEYIGVNVESNKSTETNNDLISNRIEPDEDLDPIGESNKKIDQLIRQITRIP